MHPLDRNGPYLVEGSVPIARQTIVADGDGNSVDWRQGDRFETTGRVNVPAGPSGRTVSTPNINRVIVFI